MSLPSYSAAVSDVRKPAVWQIIAPYLDTSMLSSLCRNSETSDAATAQLWANPMLRILSLPRSCVRLIHFFDHAQLVREEIRNYVLTLDLRNLGVHSLLRRQCRMRHDPDTCENTITGRWVCRSLHLFPKLRFLLLDELPGFHNMGFAIFGPTRERQPGASAFYPLMISAANCLGLNPLRITASENISNLIYVDLSGARGDYQWPGALAANNLPKLRVLKLRNSGLIDSKIPSLLTEVSKQLWSLDLRDNRLTEGIIKNLLKLSAAKLPFHQSYEDVSPDHKYDEDPPYYTQESPDYENMLNMQDVVSLRPDSEDGLLNYITLHGNMINVHPLEDNDIILRMTGLTHLYLSGNNFSSHGVAELLQSKLVTRLQYLDVGSVKGTPPQTMHKPWGMSRMYSQTSGLSKLARSSAMRLEVLRIHHSIITSVPSISNHRIPPGELPFLAEAEQRLIDPRSLQLTSPDTNPRIHTLILTDVPRRTLGPVIERLKRFIQACANQEKEIATIISATPRTRRSPKILPGLRLLRLEFQDIYQLKRHNHIDNTFASYGSSNSASVSGDPDADEFISQSMNDFSFFSSNDPPRPSPAVPPRRQSTAPVPRSLEESRDVARELQEWRNEEDGRKWGGSLEMVFQDCGEGV